MIAMGDTMARMEISPESTWLLQARDFLEEARRLKPGPARNELRQTAKVLREIARLEAKPVSASALDLGWPKKPDGRNPATRARRNRPV